MGDGLGPLQRGKQRGCRRSTAPEGVINAASVSMPLHPLTGYTTRSSTTGMAGKAQPEV
jgi:hypothetical protein